jgi:phospholipid transport system transporter-binding protein
MIRREGRRMTLSGPVTLSNVAGVRQVDLAGVTEMDSALLALLLTWLRDAKAQRRELAFLNLPESLQTIARLYGVDNLLPVSGKAASPH